MADYDPTTDPRAIAFQRQQAQLAPVLNARTPEEWLRAMAGRGNLSAGERALMAKVQSQPDRYEIRGGTPVEKPSWLSRNMYWLGPAAIVGGAAAPLAFGGGGGAAAGAGGVAGSHSYGPLIAAQAGATGTGVGAAGAAGAAAGGVNGVERAINRAQDAGGRSIAGRIGDVVGGAVKGLNPFEAAALAALAGLPALLANKGPSAEEKALMEQARQMQLLQQQRIQQQNPLFEAVTRLAMSRLPTGAQKPGV